MKPVLRLIAALFLALAMMLGLLPSSVTPQSLEPEAALASDFQVGCAVSVGLWFVPWAKAGTTVAKFASNRYAASALAVYTTGWGCTTYASSYPNGQCTSWNGPRGRCDSYANGCNRFGTPYQRSLCN